MLSILRDCEVPEMAAEKARWIPAPADPHDVDDRNRFREYIARITADFAGVDSHSIGAKTTDALEMAGRFHGADRAAVYWFSRCTTRIAHVYQWRGAMVHQSRPGFTGLRMERIPWCRSIIVHEKRAIAVPDISTLPRDAFREYRILRDLGIRSVIMVPVYADTRTFGFLCLESMTGQPSWNHDEAHGLTILAQLLANAFRGIEAEQKLSALKARSDAECKRARDANRAKSEFISSMSHELRAPLNAILGFGQVMNRDAALSEQHKEFVREIINAGSHLLTLINEVLDLSRIEAGRVRFSPEPVCCSVVIRDAIQLITPFATRNEIRLETVPSGNLSVRADRVRLKQVLLNLLSNGIKYNSHGGCVTVRTVERAHSVRISVTDTGAGIPAERMGELFTRYSRLGREESEVEGTGIGLALSKRLVNAMDGSIGVESTPGKGSTFWVELPQCDAPPDGPVDTCEDSSAERRRTFRAATVLYIEDNPVDLRLMEHAIGRIPGYHLVTAHTDREILDRSRVNCSAVIPPVFPGSRLTGNLYRNGGYRFQLLVDCDFFFLNVKIILQSQPESSTHSEILRQT